MNHYGIETCPGPLFAPRAPSVNGSVTSAKAADSLDATTLNRASPPSARVPRGPARWGDGRGDHRGHQAQPEHG